MGYRVYNIPKSKGKFRTISEPDVDTAQRSLILKDKMEQWLDHMNFWDTKYGDCIWAYRPGRSIPQLINKIYDFLGDCTEYDVFYLDVKDFFGSIRAQAHISGLRDLSVSQLGQARVEMDFTWEYLWELIHPTQFPNPDLGISQGNPLSPLVANIVGSSFLDYPILWETNGLNVGENVMYARYSDNLYFICKRTQSYSRQAMYTKIADLANDVIKKYNKFELSIKVKGSHQRNIILGVRLGATKGQLKDKNWLRSLFYRIDTKGERILRDQDIIARFGKNLKYDKFIEKVRGLITYVLSVDSSMEEYIMEHVSEDVLPRELKEIANAEGWQALQQEE